MAEYREVIKQFKRMCKAQEECDKCPLTEKRGILTCWRALIEYPEMEEVVMQWAKYNPPKTNRVKFAEVFGCDPVVLDFWNQRGGEWLFEEYEEPKDD